MSPPDPAPSRLSRALRWLGSPDARPELGALICLPFLVALLFMGGRQLPPIIIVFLAAASMAAVLLLFRRSLLVLLGPMFFYDLLCYARRGRYIALRCLYAGCLLAAIFGVYVRWFGAGSFGYPLPQDQVTKFATSFFMTFLSVQMLAVLLLTPVVTASAIAEEKERRRLDFLLVTQLHDHEIVLGKFASRFATVGLTLLTGLPILGLMQFLGGVDPNLVLAGFAVTLFTMVSVASVGMWMSSVCEKPISAMWLTYLLVLGYLGFCWCVPVVNLGHPAVFADIERQIGSDGQPTDVLLTPLVAYGGVHFGMSALCLVAAMQCLRPDRTPPGRVTGGVIVSPTEKPPVPVRVVPPPSVFVRARPPINEQNPLLWKELHHEQEKTHEALKVLIAVIGLYIVFVASMVCLTAIFDAVSRHQPITTVTNPMARFLGTMIGCLMLLGIVFTAVGTVSREREQHTLDNLLTLPMDRKDILWAKWLGSILSVRRLAWGLGLVWGLALVTGGLHPIAVPLLVLAFLAHGAFAASLGVWFSVVSPSKVQATLRAVVVLFGINVGSLILGENLAATTPMLCLWNLAFLRLDNLLLLPFAGDTWGFVNDSAAEARQIVLGLAGALVYAVISLILWSWACKRFAKE